MTDNTADKAAPNHAPGASGGHPAELLAKRSLRTRVVWATVAAVVVLAVLVCEATGWRFLRGPILRFAAKDTGVPVQMDGRFRLHLLWNTGIEVGHLRIGAPAGFDVPFFIDGTALQLRWSWLDLWHWRQGQVLRIKALQADTLDGNFIRFADGHATWQLTGSPSVPSQATKSTGLPHIGLLRIGQGMAKVDDRITRTDLVVNVRGVEGAAIAGDTGYTVTAKGRFREMPLKLSAKLGSALPLVQDAADTTATPLVPVHVEGQAGDLSVWFDGGAAALLSAHRLDGALRFGGPSLAAVGDPLGVTLPRTPAFVLEGRIAHNAGVWQLNAKRADIGDSQLAGDFRYDANTAPPKLTGQLRGPRLQLADLGPAVGTPGEGAGSGTSNKKRKSGKVLPEREFDLPSLRGMDADVTVAIDLLDLGTDALAPLRQLQTHVLLRSGVLRLDDLKAVVAGGVVSGATSLDASGDPARWAAKLNFSRLDLAGWITGVRKPSDAASAAGSNDAKALKQARQAAVQGGESQPVKAYLTGELTGNLNVTGQGKSTAQILGTLDGSADATLRDGTISHLVTELAGLDLAQGLGVLVKGDSPLPLRCARIDMAVEHGVLVPRQAVLDNRDSTVRVAGHIDLRTESMELRAVTRPKDISPLTFRAPVLVKGTLADPAVGIEAKALSGRAVAAAALATVVAPLAAVLPFIDMGDKERGDPCAPLPAAAAASAPPQPGGQQQAQAPRAAAR